jgi:hypothetical protein
MSSRGSDPGQAPAGAGSANRYYRRRSVMSRQGRLRGRDGERGAEQSEISFGLEPRG